MWIEGLKEEVEKTGGVRTLFNRLVPVSRTSEPLQTARLAIRSAIQGSISDILKLATIYVTQHIQDRLKARARFLLQVVTLLESDLEKCEI